MAYKVVQVISGNTFQIKPEWRIWKLRKGGDLVQAHGYELPHSDKAALMEAKIKLFNLLTGKKVELKKVSKVTSKTVVCEVYFDGKNLSEYFPEYTSDGQNSISQQG